MKESKTTFICIIIGLLAGIIIAIETESDAKVTMSLWIPVGFVLGAGIGTVLEKNTK